MADAVVVTGLGVVAPNGVGTERFWSNTLRGEGAIGPVTRFDAAPYPSRIAAEIRDFDPAEHLSARLRPQTDRMTQLALIASDAALADAGVDPAALGEFEVGVVTAGASGGFEFGQRELENLWSKGPEYVSAYQSFAWFYAVNTGQISIRHGLRGSAGVVVTEQAGGLDAIGVARRRLRKDGGVLLVGGVDASLCPWGWVAQLTGGRLSTRAEPDRAFLPFDAEASGHVPGEGGAIMVVEPAGSARARGRAGYGEIAGYGASFDGEHPRTGLRRAADAALADAGVRTAEVDVVFADAAGLPELDLIEADTISGLFGPGRVPVTAPKTMTGRLYSGGAALDLATALLSMRDGVIPPTINVGRFASGIEIDLVRYPRHASILTALVLARGHGGFNAAVVLRAPEPLG